MYIEEKLKAEIVSEALEKSGETSRCREMARRAVKERTASIRLACQAFRVSQTCYRYAGKTDAENEEIANWLLRLTDNHRNSGASGCAFCTCATSRASAGMTSAYTPKRRLAMTS